MSDHWSHYADDTFLKVFSFLISYCLQILTHCNLTARAFYMNWSIDIMRVMKTAQCCVIYIGSIPRKSLKVFWRYCVDCLCGYIFPNKIRNASTMKISVIYEWRGIIFINKLCLWKERMCFIEMIYLWPSPSFDVYKNIRLHLLLALCNTWRTL